MWLRIVFLTIKLIWHFDPILGPFLSSGQNCASMDGQSNKHTSTQTNEKTIVAMRLQQKGHIPRQNRGLLSLIN